jgi:hypothetical protein
LLIIWALQCTRIFHFQSNSQLKLQTKDGDSQRYAGNWIPRRGQDLPPALKFVEFRKYKNYNSNANHSEKCFQTCVHALNILFTTVGSELYGIGRHTKRLTILHPYFLLSFSQKNVMPNQNKGIWVSKSSSALHKSTLHQRGKGEKNEITQLVKIGGTA